MNQHVGGDGKKWLGLKYILKVKPNRLLINWLQEAKVRMSLKVFGLNKWMLFTEIKNTKKGQVWRRISKVQFGYVKLKYLSDTQEEMVSRQLDVSIWNSR